MIASRRWHWISLGIMTFALAVLMAVPERIQAEVLYPQQIEVFTDCTRPVRILATLRQDLQRHGVDLQLFELDAPAELAARLSAGLPVDPAKAQQMARQRLQALGKERLDAQIREAYGGLLQAVAYELDRYPAIVFDEGRGVVYGVTDLTQALAHYRRWREEGRDR